MTIQNPARKGGRKGRICFASGRTQITTNALPHGRASAPLLTLNIGPWTLDSVSTAPQKVLDLARAIQAEGGRALLVGGCVRDALMGREPKDWDLEVYGV